MRYLLAVAAVWLSAPVFAGSSEHQKCIDAVALAYQGKAKIVNASHTITWDVVRSGVVMVDDKEAVEDAAADAVLAIDAFINRLSDACEAMR